MDKMDNVTFFSELKMEMIIRKSMALFIVPFKIGFSAVLWCCSHVTSKRSKVPLHKNGMCKQALVMKQRCCVFLLFYTPNKSCLISTKMW